MDLGRFLRAEWDRLAGYGFLVAGAVALVFGFVGVRTSADVIDEISYLVTGGIGAVFLLGVGATLLLSADLHDDFRKLHRVEEKLDAIHRALTETHPDLVVDVRPPAPDGPDGNGAAMVGPKAGPSARVAAGAGLLAVRRFRRLAVPVGVAGAVLFLAGAILTANQASTDHVTGGVGLALSGSLLVAVMAGAMVGQLKGRLEQRTLAALGPWLERNGDADTAPAAAATEVWVVDGLTLYHRAGCRALDGRAAGRHDPAALAAGMKPCGLCEPGPRR
jgi:hypothetical protein